MLADWERYYPNCEPIGYRLRTEFPDRWVRFHSLPGSQRYPHAEAEYEELLARHNAVLQELSHDDDSVVLVTTGYSETPEPIRYYPEVVAFDPDAQPWRTVAMHSIDGEFADPNYWHMFAGKREWCPGDFDPLVRLIADDIVADVLIVAPDCRWILHPYDGGMDVIAESSGNRDSLRTKFHEWLSAHPQGL